MMSKIEGLYITHIDAPSDAKFIVSRNVLAEKIVCYESIINKFSHLSKTTLKAGEYVWLIDSHSLVIERYVISASPSEYPKKGEVKRVYLYDRKGDAHGVSILVQDYVGTINETFAPISISGRHSGGRKLLCSSERNVLLSLSVYIPKRCREILYDIDKKNWLKIKHQAKKLTLKNCENFTKK